MIQVLLGQRGTLFRGALATVLSAEPDLTVVAELDRADDILPIATRERPDVALLDASLPGPVTVGELCPALCQSLPACGVLILLDRPASAALGRALARLAPRVGFIGIETSTGDLVEGVRQVARGEPVLDAQLAVAALTAGESPLTDREREVLRLAVDGTPPSEIAQALFLSTGTVRNYLSRILAKTGARTRIEAIRIAQDAGWI
ncbi:response regulator transcription factor [Phytohabitans aurantiacus]|uniref:DNA-binding response regulator n=1 Tax=Phytohabitans aurantiacus TaxID=3016789 RepID=A0ABQ5R5C5_9ACTN|nr:response regulator transcription factor [Phytohabitans aurantiacus]GLI01600.1 DNA-binding response regulator [Phytohabitans aurantiacus]